MKIPRGEIKLANLQIKSVKAFKKAAKALTVIEETMGIHEVKVSIDGIWVCHWIDWEAVELKTPMEELLKELIIKTR